ncbi:MAG TPA: hypothetical protein VGT08_10905 [Terracidiphilus sp.]|nr:hypothetical protein [Terracidiphilus sp.]
MSAGLQYGERICRVSGCWLARVLDGFNRADDYYDSGLFAMGRMGGVSS